MKYRKKPVVIEAVQWTGENIHEIMKLSPKQLEIAFNPKNYDSNELLIFTLEGAMTAIVGDWIIKGIKGEFYPCKPEIFEATYEAVEEA